MNLVAKLNNASFKKILTLPDGSFSYTVGGGFDFNFELYKDNTNYKFVLNPIRQTIDNKYGLKVDTDIERIQLDIYIGNKNVLTSSNLIGSIPSIPFGNNCIHTYGFTNSINNYFNSSENIDITNLKITFTCYKYKYSSSSEYKFEQTFRVPLTNKTPEITNVQANFPTVSFNVSDDKRVNKVEVFINNALKRTIVNGLNNTITLNFNNTDFNIGENTLVLRAIDSDNVFVNKTIKVKKGKVPIPKKGIKIVKKNKIYTIVSAEENLKADELILTLDRNLEEVSSINEPIEILDKYAIVKINDKPMKHISSKNIANDEIEDKFELDITTRKVTLRVDLERVDSYGSIYIREIQEAFQYNKD